MKTLLITYLPTGQTSNTRKLLQLFLAQTHGQKVETLDLLRNPPPFFTEESMGAYYKRNYAGKSLSPQESELLKGQDQLVEQFKSADVVVMAYPMHNFSMPASVKAYFDSVISAGQTFEHGPQGPRGLMAGKKALTLFTSGGSYPDDKVTRDYPFWDALTALARIEFNFMGFSEIEIVGTSLRDPEKAPENLAASGKKISEIVTRWYR